MAFQFGYSNLVVSNGSTSNNVNMTADWIVVADGAWNTLRIPMTSTITIDKSSTTQTSTMVNGRDQAATFPVSTWIYIWAIYNPVTNTIAGLFSLSATAPTLPSGYTHKAWVGAVYSAVTTGNFVSFHQTDNRVVVPTSSPGNTNATTLTGITVADGTVSYCPNSAKTIAGWIYCSSTTANAYRAITIACSSATDSLGSSDTSGALGGAGTSTFGCLFNLPLIGTQLFVKANNADTNVTIFISGWGY